MKKFPVLKTTFEGQTLRVETLPFGVQRICLMRSEIRNAFDEVMISELSKVLADLAATRDKFELRVLLLEGDGPVFCAGADLAYMKSLAAKGEPASLQDARFLGQLFFRLANFPVPVICAVKGAAIGGGLGLTACSDFVLAEEQAVFATSEVLLGIVPAVISPYIVRKIGLGNAAPFMLSGERFSAGRAKELGLVQEVAPQIIFDIELEKSLVKFLRAGPDAARRTKELLRKVSPLPNPNLFEATASAIAAARVSDEGQEGMGAFFEKRNPGWSQELSMLINRDSETKV